ncbi:hypothetical protein GQ457_16G019230 [Hibiscus cannabinus]
MNLPLVEAHQQIPNYAKFLKDMVSKKRRIGEFETVDSIETCLALMYNNVQAKKTDPENFTIECFIGHNYSTKALCDPGASINLMLKSVSQKLGIGEAKPTTVMLQLTDHSFVQPEGKIEDILVRIDKFIFPADFLILDCEADEHAPIILGRPFLATRRVLLEFGNDKFILREDKLIKTLQQHKEALGWTITDIKGISLAICMHKILLEDNHKPSLDAQRRLNQAMKDVVRKEILKWLDAAALATRKKYLLDAKNQIFYSIGKNATSWLMKELYSTIRSLLGEWKLTKAKIDVISKLPSPTTVKGVHSFLGYVGLYRRFIENFFKITKPLCSLIEQGRQFEFDDACTKAFEILKNKPVTTPIVAPPDWTLPFELMCDASDYAVGAVLGQRKGKTFHPIYYVSKTLNGAQVNYSTIEKELLAIIFAFDKFRSYLIRAKVTVYTDHSSIKYLLAKKDATPRLIRWILLLQEFDVEIIDRKKTENQVVDHLSD